jgi:hypothetical protein
VEVEGSWDNWTSRTPLLRNGKDFTLIKLLPPGVYQVGAVGPGLAAGGLRGVCLQVGEHQGRQRCHWFDLQKWWRKWG